MLDCDLVFKSDYGVFMSIELLKEIDEKFDECYERNLKPSFEWMVCISERLKKALTHPDIKPVAWALFSKDIMPSGSAYAIRRVEIQLAQIESDLGIQDAEIRPLFLKGDLLPQDQSALIEQLRQAIDMKEFDLRERDQRIKTLSADIKSWKVLYKDETEAYEAKIKALEYQLKQLSVIHSATVNALADERNSKALGNA